MSDNSFSVNEFIFDAEAGNSEQLALHNATLGPVLVHFWSRKAGASFRLYPVLESLVESYRGGFLLVNIDVDKQRPIAKNYSIASVPIIKLFMRGSVVETLFGFQNEQDLRFILDQYVASDHDRNFHDPITLFQQGQQELGYQKIGQAALELFHHIMRMDRKFEDNLGHRSILKILHLLEDSDPLQKEYRNVFRH